MKHVAEVQVQAALAVAVAAHTPALVLVAPLV
jgi:hypothetical protein